jgi:uncharacterized damage-inducible protein DinB
MDTKTYIQQQIARARHWSDLATQDLTSEVLNWLPPGTVNPISAILLHMVFAEDHFIQTILQGTARCWDHQDRSREIGIRTPPGGPEGWDEFKTTHINLAAVQAYEQTVRAATDAYLARLTVEELERQVDYFGNTVPVAYVLMTLVVHTASHAGEIAALKGTQGVQGLAA